VDATRIAAHAVFAHGFLAIGIYTS